MAKTPKQEKSDVDDAIGPAEAQRRMDEAVKRMLSTPPETHDEMVKRRRQGKERSRKK